MLNITVTKINGGTCRLNVSQEDYQAILDGLVSKTTQWLIGKGFVLNKAEISHIVVNDTPPSK